MHARCPSNRRSRSQRGATPRGKSSDPKVIRAIAFAGHIRRLVVNKLKRRSTCSESEKKSDNWNIAIVFDTQSKYHPAEVLISTWSAELEDLGRRRKRELSNLMTVGCGVVHSHLGGIVLSRVMMKRRATVSSPNSPLFTANLSRILPEEH